MQGKITGGGKVSTKARRWTKILRWTLLATLFVLSVQFVLGMMTNLYVEFPSSLPHGDASQWVMLHSALTMTHIWVGTLLLLLSLLAIVFAIPARNKTALVLSLLGMILTLTSWISGVAFLANGQQNLMSMMMAIAFLVSVFVYVGEYIFTSRTSLT